MKYNIFFYPIIFIVFIILYFVYRNFSLIPIEISYERIENDSLVFSANKNLYKDALKSKFQGEPSRYNLSCKVSNNLNLYLYSDFEVDNKFVISDFLKNKKKELSKFFYKSKKLFYSMDSLALNVENIKTN